MAKLVLMMYSPYAGQVLWLADATAATAVTDGWAKDLTNQPYPWDSSGINPNYQNVPLSYRQWLLLTQGGLSNPIAFTSISNASPAVVTAPAGSMSQLNDGNALIFSGTGTSLDGTWVNVQNKGATTFEITYDASAWAGPVSTGEMRKVAPSG